MDDIKRQQSEFNDAIGYLGRLNSLFSTCDIASISLDAHSWFHTLMAVFRELSTEMKPNEIDYWLRRQPRINELIQKNVRMSRGQNQIIPELYAELNSFELFLRRIYKESGLQTKMAEDATKALR